MIDGELIRRIRYARPWLPAIVLLDEPYGSREIYVRSTGVGGVLPAGVDHGFLREIVGQVLKLEEIAAGPGYAGLSRPESAMWRASSR